MNREEWLNIALRELEEHVFIPNQIIRPNECMIKVSCGWPAVRALSVKKRTVGYCHKREQSGDKWNEIFISPLINDSLEVLATEVHEVVHAYDDCKSHHKGFFLKTMKTVGLEGKPTATHAGDLLTVCLNAIIERIGIYPHSELNPAIKDKKQSTRLVKAECPACGYVIRTTRKWITEAGLPTCSCGAVFQEGTE